MLIIKITIKEEEKLKYLIRKKYTKVKLGLIYPKKFLFKVYILKRYVNNSLSFHNFSNFLSFYLFKIIHLFLSYILPFWRIY